MKLVMAIAVVGYIAALGAVRPAPHAQEITPLPQQQATSDAKTVWDGVYTPDQAKRGRAEYDDQCASCHGAELSGGEMAPPLAGGAFLTNWNGETAGSLEERIRTSMPQGAEGTLSRQQVVDIISALFAANNMPPGTAELPKEPEVLKTIQITAKKP
jgi:mono/diheme cytochrome c family protein